ncbi:MAG: hypothetical protein M3O70_21355 [Actinomycetota bacterium]|nr:hypothetical protein [Actinomycetota bacterium]
MKRGLPARWPASVFGTACVLLAACSWSPQPTGRPPADHQMPAVAAAPYDDHLMQRTRLGAVHEPVDAAGAGQSVHSGGPTASPLPVADATVPPVPAQAPAGEEAARVGRPAPSARTVHEPNWSPFATAGGVTLLHPASRVERVGFHESNHDGARQLTVHPSAANPATLESRGRDTGSRSAADVVVDPEVEIRVPVSGTVIRSGTYVLYCEYSDDFAVIEPKDHPGWEVKVLHIDGVRVSRGDRVEAGVTVLAARATRLPFRSQVDDYTAEPSWPHVHIEVIDPSIPDRPSSGGGC